MICKGPYPNLEIPDVPIASFILEHSPQFAERPALTMVAHAGETQVEVGTLKASNLIAGGNAPRIDG